MSDEQPKVGRPTKYKDEYCQQLIEHMKVGGSFESFAGKCSVHWDTLYEWCKVIPEFSEAKRIGLALLLLYDEQTHRAGALGQLKFAAKTIKTTDKNGTVREETTHTPASFSASYSIFLMKNRYPKLYRDKIVVENETGDAGKMAEIFDEIMSDPNLTAAAAIIAKKLATKE